MCTWSLRNSPREKNGLLHSIRHNFIGKTYFTRQATRTCVELKLDWTGVGSVTLADGLRDVYQLSYRISVQLIFTINDYYRNQYEKSFSFKFKIIHVPCSMKSHRTHARTHICTKNCTIIWHNDMQTRGKPPTCFVLFGFQTSQQKWREVLRILEILGLEFWSNDRPPWSIFPWCYPGKLQNESGWLTSATERL